MVCLGFSVMITKNADIIMGIKASEPGFDLKACKREKAFWVKYQPE